MWGIPAVKHAPVHKEVRRETPLSLSVGGQRRRCGGSMQVRCSAYLYQVSVKQAVKAAVSGGSGWGREGSCSVLGFRGGARAFHEVRERRSGQPWYKGCLRHNLHPSSLILSPFQTTEGEGIEREVTARRAGQKVVIPPQFPPKKSKPDP